MTMERASTAADESYEELYRAAPFGYITTTPDDVIVRSNDAFAELVGRAHAQLIGSRFGDLLEPGARILYENRHLPMLHLEGQVNEISMTVLRPDGTVVPVLVNASLVRDGAGEPRLARIAAFDSTTRERYERELLAAQRSAESSAARVTVLQNASAAFSASASEEALGEALATIVGDALAATAACVALVRENDRLEVIAGINPLDGLIDPLERRPGAEVMASEVPVSVSSTDEAYPGVADALRAARLESLSVFPIMRNGTSIGVVAAFFGRERVLDDSATDLVIAIAQQAAQTFIRIRLQEQLTHLALHDQLTGLANRPLLREHVTQGLAVASRAANSVAVMFIDLDGFKAVNDRLGHNVGDAVLREVAQRVRSVVRETDLIGRYGGDEFVVVCSNTSAETAKTVAARICEAVRAPFEDAPGFAITASIGIAVHDGSDDTDISTDEIIAVADTAMYASKNDGRDRVTVETV